MRLTYALLPTFALFCVVAAAIPASAQGPAEQAHEGAQREDPVATEVISEEAGAGSGDTLAHNARILDELLERSAQETIREQKFAAAAGITGGAIMLGIGAWRLIENDPQSQYSRGLGVMFTSLGMADLTLGIFAATRISHERRRLSRWERAREDGITDIELAHFEGELQASHETRQGERLVVRWGGLTHAIAGLFVLAFTPIPDSMSRTDRVSGYVIGSLFLAAGVGTFAASFRDTPNEKAWQEYNKRKMPMPGHEFSWGIAPSVSRRGAGLSFGGRF